MHSFAKSLTDGSEQIAGKHQCEHMNSAQRIIQCVWFYSFINAFQILSLIFLLHGKAKFWPFFVCELCTV
jgi:hypothetical protein